MASVTKRDPQLSISLPSYAADDPGDWGYLLDFARQADIAGFDRLLVSDHVVYGEHLEAYSRPELGGVQGGTQPTGSDGHWLDPLITLSVVAGITSQIRLSTNILQAAIRRPVVLAKQLATLDVLSNGRLDIGVGVGWQREEYEAAGLDFDSRGRLLDHTLTVCETLWRDQVASLETPELSFKAIHMQPKPRQAGGVPIWVSGRINKAVVRRLARFGQGWIPWGDDAADLATSVSKMRTAVTEAGGTGDALQVSGSLPIVRLDDGEVNVTATMEKVRPLVDAGVTDLRTAVKLPANPEYLAELVGAFRQATA